MRQLAHARMTAVVPEQRHVADAYGEPDMSARPKLNSLGLTDAEARAARALQRTLGGAPTLGDLVRHAELYGVAMVYETGAELLGESELVQLALELTRIEGKPTGRRFSGKAKRRKRLSTEQKIRAAEHLRAEGVPNSRIATHLGLSERQVERLFQQARSLRAKAQEVREPDTSAAHEWMPA